MAYAYHAVGDRCAVRLSWLRTASGLADPVSALMELGFCALSLDMIELARSYIGVSKYMRGATIYSAPHIVDCSLFMKWLYGKRGIWVPRMAYQQHAYGVSISADDMVKNDLVFLIGGFNFYDPSDPNGISHVGMMTANDTVIHATNFIGVEEVLFDEFVGSQDYRISRIIDPMCAVITFAIPPAYEVETSDDFRHILIKAMSGLSATQ